MTEFELQETESLAERLRAADLSGLDEVVADELHELLEDVPWMVSEIRRLRAGPGRLGALLRFQRLDREKSVEEGAHQGARRPEAGSVPITPEEVRALEEGTQPIGARWPDVLRAIGAVLEIPATELVAD